MLLADRLKIARTLCEYTQQQIADILGIDRTAYTNYECGKMVPPSTLINRLAALYRIDVSWFMGEVSAMGILSESDDIFELRKMVRESGLLELSDEEKELVGLFRMLQGIADKDKLNEVLRNFEREFESENNEKDD